MKAATLQQELFIKMVLLAWEGQNNNLHRFLTSFPDEQLARETAPGKNTGIYLLGHLIAVSDSMLPLLGFGEKLFPALENVFIRSPDKSGLDKPSVTELKGNLQEVNAKLAEHFQSATPLEWFGKHTVVSEEDFSKEPHRNKLNIIITRTHHMAYHLGQMALLKR